jgi:hypothetical protein
MLPATSAITIKVEDYASKSTKLEHAISLLRKKGTGCGILVTRVDFTTVTLRPNIPFGLTWEIDLL